MATTLTNLLIGILLGGSIRIQPSKCIFSSGSRSIRLNAVCLHAVIDDGATGANTANQMDWELSGGLSPDYLQ